MRRLTVILLCCSFSGFAQDDLMSLLNDEEGSQEVEATFKSTRLISGQTTEMRTAGILDFVISHRFGTINQGIEQFYGLDDSQIRLGLDYGITDRFNVGIGRSSFQKIVDGSLKYKILIQQTGEKSIPVSLVAFTSLAIKTGEGAFTDPTADHPFSDRLYSTFQLLASRKMNTNLSLQFMPTFMHRNLVPSNEYPNDVIALGVGGRYKISKRVAINAEWFPQVTEKGPEIYDALSFGVDIETGGHVFQIHITNSRSMIEQGFISETTGNWGDRDIHLGFNISRVFDLSPKK
ncbi:hypothetical protein SAMN04488029_3601 [Reichenbachiella faecimaris]|uniref:DUF5777 domain-containing protein n=1 Tax=Reichenbachiella faecimaris TaxID=692418 RepID=A0A1W2GN07_REIFA|nr:DUF5777 family beta-barrel protein [Reichenbachiella faecimaris]SMD38037.1 hypothetical protein SAMN04488029_3601 [Reichenbachiella faecimaris]